MDNSNYYLPFIEYQDLYSICKEIIDVLQNANDKIESTIHRNIIDPFSAIFEASFYKLSLEDWLEKEKSRQIHKTFQNTIGGFHQKVLGKIKGWEDLASGNVVDIVNHEKKIIAEIKNKYNTTKGNHKVAIYDDIASILQNKYTGYTGYYVAIIDKRRINIPFTPSDNKTKTIRKENKNIRQVDGRTFYTIATGNENAIDLIYKSIPIIISEITGSSNRTIIQSRLFVELFEKSFK